MSSLRPYQSEAFEAAKDWMKQSVEPGLIEAPTGAGKSHIIAALADWLHGISKGKRVLCLAPQAELVAQNAKKFRSAGGKCSIFSASAGSKSTRHPVVFATPLTVKNSISRFMRGYCAVVLDEAHNLSPTVKAIVEAMQASNPTLRVIGCTATPFRLGSGYIFRMWHNGRVTTDENTREPFFTKLVYTIDANSLIDQGYLTRPVIGAINSSEYDTSGLKLKPNGQFDPATVDVAFAGHGRKTAAIVGDVVAQSQNRKGVVFFAATIQHAEEIMASLPPSLSAIITGETPTKERKHILARFDRHECKYLVNVAVLTTGWDAPHVDVIALLRRTESVGLLQQIIGRGLRIDDGKQDCLILDYASNIESHMPDGNLFAPTVKASKSGGGDSKLEAACPDCGYANEFTLHKDYLDYEKDANGYCLDVFKERIETEYGPAPGHYGRRCANVLPVPGGKYQRCGYYWTSKECEACGEKNDIAARRCRSCKAEIINPNDKLVADFKALKRDPTRPQTDKVLEMTVKESVSKAGNEIIRVDFVTPYRQFSFWMMKNPKHSRQMADLQRFENATALGQPETVTYHKDRDSGFFRVLAYGQPVDEEPETA